MNTNKPSFHEFRKQASFFLKEKIKTARLALTDVTPTQLLAEEAINGDTGSGPDAKTLKIISKSAFEVDDYWRIVETLHKRLVRFDRRDWRGSYNALLVLEHLMTHGPESVAEEFQSDRDVITDMETFQHIDEKGFNWGLNVRRKAERILKLLEKGPLLKEERDRARKISRGIQGFGSFSHRTSSGQEILQQPSQKAFDRCKSQFTNQTTQEDFFSAMNVDAENKTQPKNQVILTTTPVMKSSEKVYAQVVLKENLVPTEEIIAKEPNEGSWDCKGESNPLLDNRKDGSLMPLSVEEHHPFEEAYNLSKMSLL